MKKIVEAKYTGLRFDEKVLGTKEMGSDCSTPDVSFYSNKMSMS